jgi:hypothetical protein
VSNGSEACCALGICCPPASAAQRAALALIISDNAPKDRRPLTSEAAAAVVLEHFDLAPKGLQAVLVEAVRLSKHTKGSL